LKNKLFAIEYGFRWLLFFFQLTIHCLPNALLVAITLTAFETSLAGAVQHGKRLAYQV